MKFHKMGHLGKRLFVLLSIMISICLLVMMIQGIHCSHRAVKKAAEIYLLSVAKCKQEHLELWLQERALDIKMLSETSCLTACCSKEFAEASFCSIFYSIQNRSDAYKRFSIYTKSGQELFSTKKSNFDFVQTKLFKDITKKENSLEMPYFDYQNLPLVNVICGVNNNRQIMLVEMDISGVLNKLVHHKIALGKSDKIYITNKLGKILAEDEATSFESAKIIEQTVKIKSVGIIIKAIIPWQEAMAEMYLYIKFSTSTVIATLMIMFFLVWKMSAKISEPILKIASAARKITEGDIEQRVDYEGKDEIGTLIKDFNSMANRLSSNQKSMEKKHQQLQNAYNKIEETKLQLIKIEALAATGKMAASIVHEIRNPLSTIKMNLQILVRTLDNNSKFQEHGEIAINQVHHLESMLTDLLNYSRPINLEKEECNLADLITESIQLVSGEVTSNQVSIKSSLSSLRINCDSKRLQQVIANLSLNAIQASKATEYIHITTHSSTDQKIVIEIVDNGKGISQENIENIFEPFFSLRKGGIGLGLSYAKKIVQLHNGTIEVESNLGKGSCFKIILPS